VKHSLRANEGDGAAEGTGPDQLGNKNELFQLRKQREKYDEKKN